jgi:hypothetical protein
MSRAASAARIRSSRSRSRSPAASTTTSSSRPCSNADQSGFARTSRLGWRASACRST